jgi:ribosomal protein S18 acetylase RimI-like enzyme
MASDLRDGKDALEIRRITPGLADALGRFFEKLSEAGDYRVFHPHPLTAIHAHLIASGEGEDLYYALTHGDEVLGYGMLRGWDEGYAVPSLGLAIAPQQRGHGLGKLLLAFLHEAARRKGARQVRLKVHAENAGALALYRSLGYVFGVAEQGQLVGLLALTQENPIDLSQ